MNYRPDIDGLRTLAVVPVVLFHANVQGFSGGFVGVDIFFVISGFLITTIIHRELCQGNFSILRFYERRARRILPALFAVIMASITAGWFLLAPSDYVRMGQSILSALFFVSNIWFWQNSGGYFDGATDYLPMLHTWSLAVEEQFYIFFPLLLMLLHRIGRRVWLPVVLVLVVGSLVVAIWATPRMSSASFYLLPTRIWELGLGALLAMGILPTTAPRGLREGVGALGLVAVLVTVCFYDGSTEFPGLAALPPVLGAAALIWAGTAGPVVTSHLLSLRPMVWVGLISYSLYLWHWPIMAFARNWLFTVELDLNWQAATVLASFAAGGISWRFIERPFRVPVRDGGMTQGRIFALSGAGMAVLGVLAGACITSESINALRFSQEELAFLRDDGFDPRALECREKTRLEDFCQFGNVAGDRQPKWIVWGDSHAEAMMPAFDALAHEKNESLLHAVRPGCAPLPEVERLEHSPVQRRRCLEMKRQVERFLMESGQIDTVFLHARWPLYVEGSRYGPAEMQKITLLAPGFRRKGKTASEGNPAIVSMTLDGLVLRLTQAGLKVILVSSVPEVPWNVQDGLKSHVLYGRPFPEDPKLEIVKERQLLAETILKDISERYDATLVLLTPNICSDTCPTHDNSGIYYRDTNHLTPMGAKTLVLPLLQDALDEKS